MGKDFKSGGDTQHETRSDNNNDIRSDYGGDLAKEEGVSLNVSEVSKVEGLTKAVMMSYDVPPLPPLDAQIRQINEGIGEGPDNRGIEEQQPRKPESANNCDPPYDRTELSQMVEQFQTDGKAHTITCNVNEEVGENLNPEESGE